MDNREKENLYALSNGINDIVQLKDIKKTELGKVFDKKLRENDLKIICSEFIDLIGYCIFLYFDGTKEFTAKDKCSKGYTVYTPNKLFSSDILSLFKESVSKCGIPYLIEDNQIKIFFKDFYTTARVVYFSRNIYELDRLTRAEFPDIDFFLRFSLDVYEPGYYYLIFKSRDILNCAKKQGKIKEIKDYVNLLCRHDDKLGIFKNYEVVPFVSDKDTLFQNGEVTGIMRNNPDFTDW